MSEQARTAAERIDITAKAITERAFSGRWSPMQIEGQIASAIADAAEMSLSDGAGSAQAAWNEIARAEDEVFGDHLSFESVRGIIESALTAYAAEIWEAAAKEIETALPHIHAPSIRAQFAAALRAHAISRQEENPTNASTPE